MAARFPSWADEDLEDEQSMSFTPSFETHDYSAIIAGKATELQAKSSTIQNLFTIYQTSSRDREKYASKIGSEIRSMSILRHDLCVLNSWYTIKQSGYRVIPANINPDHPSCKLNEIWEELSTVAGERSPDFGFIFDTPSGKSVRVACDVKAGMSQQRELLEQYRMIITNNNVQNAAFMLLWYEPMHGFPDCKISMTHVNKTSVYLNQSTTTVDRIDYNYFATFISKDWFDIKGIVHESGSVHRKCHKMLGDANEKDVFLASLKRGLDDKPALCSAYFTASDMRNVMAQEDFREFFTSMDDIRYPIMIFNIVSKINSHENLQTNHGEVAFFLEWCVQYHGRALILNQFLLRIHCECQTVLELIKMLRTGEQFETKGILLGISNAVNDCLEFHDDEVCLQMDNLMPNPDLCTVDANVVMNVHNEIEKDSHLNKKHTLIHTYESKPSRHFLVTAPMLNMTVSSNAYSIPDYPSLKAVSDYPAEHKFGSESDTSRIILLKSLLGDLPKNSQGRVSFVAETCVTRESFHEDPCCLTPGALFLDEKTSDFGFTALNVLAKLTGADDFVPKFMAIQEVIKALYRHPEDDIQLTTKSDRIQRRNLFRNVRGFQNFTGYVNKFKTVGLYPSSVSNREFMETLGSGKKKKDKLNLKTGAEDLNTYIANTLADEGSEGSPFDLDSAVREATADYLNTKPKALFMSCRNCQDHAGSKCNYVYDHAEFANDCKISDRVTQLFNYYENSSILEGDVLESCKKSFLELGLTSLSKSLFCTSELFRSLMVVMNTTRAVNEINIIPCSETGRYLVVLPSTDKSSGQITYMDLWLCQKEIPAELIELNEDVLSLGYRSPRISVLCSKPMKLDRVRVEVLSKVWLRFLISSSIFSNDYTSYNKEGRSMYSYLAIASGVTKSSLALYDLMRHQFNLCMASVSNYKQFMLDKYEAAFKSLSDFHMYQQIKNWMVTICQTKDLINLDHDPSSPDDEAERQIMDNAYIFQSPLTNDSFLNYGTIINTVFGCIYMCSKGLHNRSTNLHQLSEVPAKFQVKLEAILKGRLFAPEVFQGQGDFSHDLLSLISAQNSDLTTDNMNFYKQALWESTELETPVQQVSTFVSTKSSVKTVSSDVDASINLMIARCYTKAVSRDSANLLAKLIHKVDGYKNLLKRRRQGAEEIISGCVHKDVRTSMRALAENENTVNKFVEYPEAYKASLLSKKQDDAPELKTLDTLLQMEDYVMTARLPVKSNFYDFIKTSNPQYAKCETMVDFLNLLYKEECCKFDTVVEIFEKLQRTKVDREIYILDLITKYLIYLIEQVYFSMNKYDFQEAISIRGDEKKMALSKIETDIKRTLFIRKQEGHDVDKLYVSMDMSKFSAMDSFPKMIVSVLGLHHIRLFDRLLMANVLIRYMRKKVIIDPKILDRLQQELNLTPHNTSNIVKLCAVDQHFKRNYFHCQYNWLQGCFNHTSSRIHSTALRYFSKILNRFLERFGSGSNFADLRAMVHSDDGAIGVVYSLNQAATSYIKDNYGSFQQFFMLFLGVILKKFGIILNPTKTFGHPDILDFISDYIIRGEPIGTYSRQMATLLSPLDHKSYLLDASQVGGVLQNLVKSNPLPQNLYAACVISMMFVHDTYNFLSPRAHKVFNVLKQRLKVDKLPLCLFGPIDLTSDLIGAAGLKANDINNLLKMVVAMISKLPENSPLKTEIRAFVGSSNRLTTTGDIKKYLFSSDNITKVDLSSLPGYDRLLPVSCFLSSDSFTSEATSAFDFVTTNCHLLKVPIPKQQSFTSSRFPVVRDMLRSIKTPSAYLSKLSDTLRDFYTELFKDNKELKSFITSQELSALKSSTIDNLLKLGTTESRFAIISGARKPLYTLKQLYSQIDTNTLTSSFYHMRAANFTEKIEEYYKSVAQNYLKKARLEKNAQGKPIDDIILEDIRNAQSVADIPIFNDLIEQALGIHSKQVDSIRDKLKGDIKYTILECVEQMPDIVSCLQQVSKDDTVISTNASRAFTRYFANNINTINAVARSFSIKISTSADNRRTIRQNAIYRYIPERNIVKIEGDMKQNLLQTLNNNDHIVSIIYSGERNLPRKVRMYDLVKALKLHEEFLVCQDYFIKTVKHQDTSRSLQFHFSFNLMEQTLSSIFNPKLQKTHFFYSKALESTLQGILEGVRSNSNKTGLCNPTIIRDYSVKVTVSPEYLAVVGLMTNEVEKLNTTQVLRELMKYAVVAESIRKAQFVSFPNMTETVGEFYCKVRDDVLRLLDSAHVGKTEVRDILLAYLESPTSYDATEVNFMLYNLGMLKIDRLTQNKPVAKQVTEHFLDKEEDTDHYSIFLTNCDAYALINVLPGHEIDYRASRLFIDRRAVRTGRDMTYTKRKFTEKFYSSRIDRYAQRITRTVYPRPGVDLDVFRNQQNKFVKTSTMRRSEGEFIRVNREFNVTFIEPEDAVNYFDFNASLSTCTMPLEKFGLKYNLVMDLYKTIPDHVLKVTQGRRKLLDVEDRITISDNDYQVGGFYLGRFVKRHSLSALNLFRTTKCDLLATEDFFSSITYFPTVSHMQRRYQAKYHSQDFRFELTNAIALFKAPADGLIKSLETLIDNPDRKLPSLQRIFANLKDSERTLRIFKNSIEKQEWMGETINVPMEKYFKARKIISIYSGNLKVSDDLPVSACRLLLEFLIKLT